MAAPFTTSVHISEVLDPNLWRERFAWGTLLSLVFSIGANVNQAELNEIKMGTVGRLPDSVVSFHLMAALSELGAQIGIPMSVIRVKTRPVDTTLVQGTDYDVVRDALPWVRAASQQYERVDVAAPLISIQRVRLMHYDTALMDLDMSDTDDAARVKIVDSRGGTFHVLPSVSAGGGGYVTAVPEALPLGSFGFGRNLSLSLPSQARGQTSPASWVVDYTTGPVDDIGNAGFLPAQLANWVAAKAGLLLMSLSGIAQGGGIASGSVSLDGLSHSFGTTASAMYGLNSAYEGVLKDIVEKFDWNVWRRQMTGVTVGIF